MSVSAAPAMQPGAPLRARKRLAPGQNALTCTDAGLAGGQVVNLRPRNSVIAPGQTTRAKPGIPAGEQRSGLHLGSRVPTAALAEWAAYEAANRRACASYEKQRRREGRMS